MVREAPGEASTLRAYDDNFAQAALKAEPVATGVACSDKVREKQLVTRTRLVGKTRTATRERQVEVPDDAEGAEAGATKLIAEQYEELEPYDEEVEYQEEVDVVVGDCPGEMMADPTKAHPQYPALHRATCSVCGWRGWA